jgi:histidinol-phosphatase
VPFDVACVVRDDALDDPRERFNFDLDPGFLEHFARARLAQSLAPFDLAAGQRPVAFARLMLPAHEQHLALLEDDRADRAQRWICDHGARLPRYDARAVGYERELDAMQRWVDETDPIALKHFAVDVATETKSDGTPVTVADREVERLLRARIDAEFSGDAIFGEEQGVSGNSNRRWIIDPIDGTKNYARGVPVFATLIALEHDGALVAGMVSAPALANRWWGARGSGAFKDGAPIKVSTTARVEDADLCTGGTDWARERSQYQALSRLSDSVRRIRGFGDFWGHVLVAQGSLDIMVEFAPLAEYDIAAPRVVVEQAGGRFTSIDGSEDPREGSVVSTNGSLHEDVLALLKS